MASDRQGSLRRAAVRASIGLILIAAIVSASHRVHADAYLTNGGFESGGTGWAGVTSTDGCAPHSGVRAAALRTTANEPTAVASQQVVTFASGSYTLSGYTRYSAGELSVSVQPIVSEGTPPDQLYFIVSPSPGYSSFNRTITVPGALQQLRVTVVFTSAQAALACLDDISLEGPPPATPTSTLTVTNPPTQTVTISPSLTPTWPPGAIATTPPVVATTAVPSATRTPAPTLTLLPGVAATLLNGGFEDGLSGWQKFGGELRVVVEPRRSGGLAGLLTSATSSTKWAFQAVGVDPALAYEFAGYLRPDAGVASAYLRISWYTAADGSGSAIATDDSTTTSTGGAPDFVYVTTGPRRPPADARAARLRVMLAPAAATANLYMDDLTLVAGPPTAAVAPPATSVAANEPVEPPADGVANASLPTSSTPAPRRSTTSRLPESSPTLVAASSPPVSEVAVLRATAAGTVVRSVRLVEQPEESSDLAAWLAVLALPLFAAGAATAYLVGKRRQG